MKKYKNTIKRTQKAPSTKGTSNELRRVIKDKLVGQKDETAEKQEIRMGLRRHPDNLQSKIENGWEGGRGVS